MSLPCRFFVVGSWIWKKNSSSSRYDVRAGSKVISMAWAGVRAVVVIRRTLHVAAGVTDPRAEHARTLADTVLHSPETPPGEDGLPGFLTHGLTVAWPYRSAAAAGLTGAGRWASMIE